MGRDERVSFGSFTLDRADERLLGPAGPVHIGNKAYRVLDALIRAEGRLLTKDALFETVWDGTIVTESALTSVIKQLRRALGDETKQPRFIESVYGRGYRFVATLDDRDTCAVADEADTTGNIPAPSSVIVGRSADMAAVSALLATGRTTTLVGPGGVGKTRMALELARREAAGFDDGSWLIELAGLKSGHQLAETVAKTMNVDLGGDSDATGLLVSRLQRRRCLIVLDNCEHLLEAVAGFAEAMRIGGAQATLLATSQEPLGVAGEQVHRLASLSGEAAVALFVERARAIDDSFVLDDRNRADVVAICEALDGLPLAVEMAAARVSSLGVAAVLARLGDRFRILTQGYRTARPRQQTLRATLEWSYGLLSETDAAVFRRLSVFSGSFSLDAASEICAGGEIDRFDVIDAISSLVAKSLVVVRRSSAGTRHALLETMRAFAAEKLAEADETGHFARAHADWYAGYMSPVWEAFNGPVSDDELLARYRVEMDNVYAALDWCYGPGGDAETGHLLLTATASLWGDRPLRRQHDIAFARIGVATPPGVRARLLTSKAHVLMRLNPQSAIPVADEAIAAARAALNEPWTLTDALCSKGFSYWFMGEMDAARRVADELREIVPPGRASRCGALARGLMACVAFRDKGMKAARPLFDEVVASLRSIGANGLANFWQSTALRFDTESDIDVQIDEWRDLVARIRPDDMYADQVATACSIELASRLARRGRPEDFDEATRLAQRFFRSGAEASDYRFFVPMTTLALHAGRPADAARMLGFIAHGRERSGGASVTREEVDRLHALVAAALDERTFADALDAGGHLDIDGAIRLALGENRSH